MTDQPSSPNPAPLPTPVTAPPPRPRRTGLLFGCIGAAVVVLLCGLVAAGGALFLARRTATRAGQTLATSVAAIATDVVPVPTRPPGVAASAPATPVAGGGSAAPASRPAAARPAGLNQPVGVPNWTVKVTGVERPGPALVISADSGGDPAAATGTWVVVALSVTRTANGAEAVGYDDVALRSGQGFTYAIPEEYWTLDNFYPAFRHGQPYFKEVPPGATVTYYLTFDVAPDATDLQFIFLPATANPATVAIGNAAP